jgi:hypothetical protein
METILHRVPRRTGRAFSTGCSSTFSAYFSSAALSRRRSSARASFWAWWSAALSAARRISSISSKACSRCGGVG